MTADEHVTSCVTKGLGEGHVLDGSAPGDELSRAFGEKTVKNCAWRSMPTGRRRCPCRRLATSAQSLCGDADLAHDAAGFGAAFKSHRRCR